MQDKCRGARGSSLRRQLRLAEAALRALDVGQGADRLHVRKPRVRPVEYVATRDNTECNGEKRRRLREGELGRIRDGLRVHFLSTADRRGGWVSPLGRGLATGDARLRGWRARVEAVSVCQTSVTSSHLLTPAIGPIF